MSEYVALTSLGPPDTLIFGYRPGDPVPEAVVEAWGLVEGEHVSSTGMPDPDAPASTPVERPGETGTRAQWEAYAVANGMDPDHAREVSQEELEAVKSETDDDVPATDDRPADSAKKADWIAYVVANGGDETWANASDTTKADLQAWVPDDQPAHSGDPVAESATEQANG